MPEEIQSKKIGKEFKKKRKKIGIVAKALDGQRYPRSAQVVIEVEGGSKAGSLRLGSSP